MRRYFVYMLRCADSSYYTGITNDVGHRIAQHEEGSDSEAYTFKRRPLILVYSAEFEDIINAIAWEKKLKRWSRKKKEALMRGEYEKLISLAWSQYRKRIQSITLYLYKKYQNVMVSSSNHGTRRMSHPSTGSG